MNNIFKCVLGVFILTVIGAQSARSATFNLGSTELTNLNVSAVPLPAAHPL